MADLLNFQNYLFSIRKSSQSVCCVVQWLCPVVRWGVWSSLCDMHTLVQYMSFPCFCLISTNIAVTEPLSCKVVKEVNKQQSPVVKPLTSSTVQKKPQAAENSQVGLQAGCVPIRQSAASAVTVKTNHGLSRDPLLYIGYKMTLSLGWELTYAEHEVHGIVSLFWYATHMSLKDMRGFIFYLFSPTPNVKTTKKTKNSTKNKELILF